jgi:ADP-ribose pyrophosphatase YjhB (NUDIX family)
MSAGAAGDLPEGPSHRLVQIADTLRALANNGLMWSNDSYQTERYEQILHLAAELLGIASTQPHAEIVRSFFADMDYKTPLAVVDTAVMDDGGRILLIRRADNGLWAMPGGACDVGETPAAAAAREVEEETGYRPQITHLLGVFDSRLTHAHNSRHLYHLLFAGHVAGDPPPPGGDPSHAHEIRDRRWFDQAEIPWAALSPGHAPRLRVAQAWAAAPQTPAYFDPLHIAE